MTTIEIIAVVLQWAIFIILYMIFGFGPGFVLGLMLANKIFGSGQPTYMETHQENIKRAAQHNAQWHPSHERWQK